MGKSWSGTFPPSSMLLEWYVGLNMAIVESNLPLEKKTDKSWWSRGFAEPENSILGSGKLTVSVGTFAIGHKRLQDPVFVSATLRQPGVQNWLAAIHPVEQLLDAVLQIVHPGLWDVNHSATQQLVQSSPFPIRTWPTAYTGMDLIVNRVTEPHLDTGGAATFYDHLLSLGMNHQAKLQLDDIEAELAYSPGTSVFLSGQILTHSVPIWSREKGWPWLTTPRMMS
ncbi:hypothetical protein JVU11DRAFT_3017 [Chiua virens]|nr:hypothetical protein JVU11DRAFT_3017 [Chiua virens]